MSVMQPTRHAKAVRSAMMQPPDMVPRSAAGRCIWWLTRVCQMLMAPAGLTCGDQWRGAIDAVSHDWRERRGTVRRHDARDGLLQPLRPHPGDAARADNPISRVDFCGKHSGISPRRRNPRRDAEGQGCAVSVLRRHVRSSVQRAAARRSGSRVGAGCGYNPPPGS